MSQRVSIVLAVFLAVSSLLSAPVLGGWNGGKKCNGGCGRKLSAGGASGHGGSGGSHYWWQDSKPFSTPNHGKTVSLGGNGGSQHQQQGSWGSQPQQQPQQPQQHGGSWGSQQPSQTYGPPPPSGGCGGGNGGGCGQPKQQPQVYPQQPQVYPQQPQVVPPGPPQVQPSNTVCNPGYECVPYHLCENGVVVSGGGLGLDLRSPPKQLRALGSPCGNNQVCCQSAPQDSYNKQQQPAVVPPGPPQQGCGGGGCGQQQQSYVPPPAASAPVPQQTYGPPQPSGGCGGGHGGGCGQPQPAPRPSTGCSGVGCLQPQPQPGFVAPVQQAPVAPKPSFGGGGGALLISSKPYTNKVPVATGSGCGPGTPGCGQPIPQQQPYQAPQPAPYQPPQPAPQPAPYQPPQPAPQPAPYQPPQPAPQPAAPYQPPQQQQPYPAPQGCSPGAPGCSQPAPQVYQPAPQPSKPNYQPQPAPQPKPSYPAPQQSGGCGPGKPGCSQPPQQQYQPAPSGGQFQNVAPPQQKPYPATGGCGGNGGAGGCGQPPRPGNNYQPQRPAQPFPAPSQGGQVQRPYPAQQRPSVPSQNSINGGYNAGRQESVTYKPYTGPTAPSVPFPGCSAGLLCVEYNFCNATGYIIPAPDPVDAQVTYRVAVMDCSNPETNIIGVCCRDPNYVDPWPQGMMMSGPGMSGAGMKKLGKRDVAAVLADEQATPKLNDKLSDSLDVDVVGEGSAGVESSEKKAPEAAPVEEKEQFVADAPEPAAEESKVASQPAEEKKEESEVNQVSNDDAQETKPEEVPAVDPVVEKTEDKKETEEPKAEQNEEIGLAKRPAPGFPAAIKPKPVDEKHEEKDESQKPEEKDDKKAISTRPSPGFPEKAQEAADEASPVEEKPAEVPAENVEAPVEEKPTNDDGEVIPELLPAEEKKEEVDNTSVQEQEKAGDEVITDFTDAKEPADEVDETQAPVKDEKVADEIAERNAFEKVQDVASDAAEEEKAPVDKKESVAPKQGAPSPFNLTRADVPSTKPTPGVIPTGQQQPAVLPPAPAVLPPIAPGFVESCGEYHDCVPYYQCDESGFIITDGSGILDLRQKPLPSALPERKCYPSDPSIGAEGASFVCCRQPPVEVCPKSEICVEGNVCPGLLTNGDGLIDPRLQPKSCILDSYRELYGVCCDPSPPVPQHCGVRNPDGVAFPAVPDLVDRIQNPSLLPANEARFAEFPWQAMIYKNLSPPTKPGGKAEAQFVCGATLISDRVLLTAAHCIKNYTVYDLEIRLGEWEINNQIEPLAYVDHRIAQIAVHPEYKAGPEFNDIAVLILEAPIVRDHHINTICLPDNPLETFSGRRCIATGWGKDAFDGVYQHVMKKVDLPVVQHADCQKYLRKTRLGNYFRLHYNFLCAGGEVNKDACTGDGGGPLVCPRADGRYVLAGITSWGIGCGKPDVPGVYAKVTSFLEWIHTVTANSTTASKPAVVPPGPTPVPSIPLPTPVVRSGISEKVNDQAADKQVVLPVEDKTEAVKNNLPETR